ASARTTPPAETTALCVLRATPRGTSPSRRDTPHRLRSHSMQPLQKAATAAPAVLCVLCATLVTFVVSLLTFDGETERRSQNNQRPWSVTLGSVSSMRPAKIAPNSLMSSSWINPLLHAVSRARRWSNFPPCISVILPPASVTTSAPAATSHEFRLN